MQKDHLLWKYSGCRHVILDSVNILQGLLLAKHIVTEFIIMFANFGILARHVEEKAALSFFWVRKDCATPCPIFGKAGKSSVQNAHLMEIAKTPPIKSTLKATVDYIYISAKMNRSLVISSYGCAASTVDIEFHYLSIDGETRVAFYCQEYFIWTEVKV